mgnify:CR=1 FL=1
MPFSLRAFLDQTGAKVGIKECVEHELLIPFPVLQEKEGEYVAHFKSTVIVLPTSTQVIAGWLDFDASRYEAENPIKSEEVKLMLKQNLWKK